MSRTSALTRKPKGLGRRNFDRGTPGHMRLSHRLQGQKVKSQGVVGAYCGGHLAAQLVSSAENTIKRTCDVLTSLQNELTSRVAMATSSGYRVEMHVIGDRAVDVALDALRDAHVAAEKRPVFIHCQVTRSIVNSGVSA